VSAARNNFRRDYGGDGPDGEPVPIMTVFRRDPDGVIRLHWASELVHAPTDPGQDMRHLGTVEPLWTLFDLTPGGRPNADEQIEYSCCGLSAAHQDQFARAAAPHRLKGAPYSGSYPTWTPTGSEDPGHFAASSEAVRCGAESIRAALLGGLVVNAFPHGTVHEAREDLQAALRSNPKVFSLWKSLTPLGRNEFICWVDDAKQSTTRQRRIERTCDELLEGKKRPCCWAGCIHRTDKAPSRWQQAVLIDQKEKPRR
jgi:hypothetical protein